MPIPAVFKACVSALPLQRMADFFTVLLGRSRWVQWMALAAAGVIAGLGQAPIDAWFMTVGAFGVLFYVYPFITSPRQAAFVVWSFGFGYFAFSLRWIIEPFLVDIARHGWMAPFALFLMGTGGALFWAMAAWIAARIAPRNAVVLALLLVAAEAMRALILTGFPWALIGHVWVPTHLAQLAAFGGPHLLSLVTMIAAFAVTWLLSRRYVLGVCVIAALCVLAFVVRPPDVQTAQPDQPLVRMVQPNAPQQQKWDPAFRDMFVNRMIALTGEGAVPDLVVWPETAMPYLLNYLDDDLQLLSDAARGAPLVFGVQRFDDQQRAYNSLAVLGAGGEIQSIYDKRHLVPFGEYIPGARLLGQVGMSGLARNLGTGFAAGSQDGPVLLDGIGAAVPLICYEGIFAEEINYAGARPRLLLLITNDAWFGQAAGPRQHLAQAQLRAIEQGLPMVRTANTGITAMIDPRGRIVASLPLGVHGAIDVALPQVAPPTPYSRFGEWPFFGLLVLLTFASYMGVRRDSD